MTDLEKIEQIICNHLEKVEEGYFDGFYAREDVALGLATEIVKNLAIHDVVKSFYCASELYEDKKCKNQCDSCIALKKLHEQ
ncbi:hypothetical protein [Algibacter sp. PT7-4]|uniref:hypothetical protein n=1 Tax=Algibacter ulvanivorans TaxID=3400999 RepID=UPI003AAE728E